MVSPFFMRLQIILNFQQLPRIASAPGHSPPSGWYRSSAIALHTGPGQAFFGHGIFSDLRYAPGAGNIAQCFGDEGSIAIRFLRM